MIVHLRAGRARGKVLLAVLAAGMLGIASSALAQIEIKFGHVGEPGSLFQKSADEFAKRANAKLGGKMFRIGHLGDFNDLMLMGTLAGVEMGLALAGVPVKKEGVQAAMAYLAECQARPARAAA